MKDTLSYRGALVSHSAQGGGGMPRGQVTYSDHGGRGRICAQRKTCCQWQLYVSKVHSDTDAKNNEVEFKNLPRSERKFENRNEV